MEVASCQSRVVGQAWRSNIIMSYDPPERRQDGSSFLNEFDHASDKPLATNSMSAIRGGGVGAGAISLRSV